MKKSIFYLLAAFAFVGCNKSDILIESTEVQTRAVSPGVISGPTSPEIGQVVTYQCIMSSTATDYHELTISTNSSGKVRFSETLNFRNETLKIAVGPGTKSFFFNAIWLGKSTSSIRLSINLGSTNLLSDLNVNPIDAKINVASSGSYLIGGEVTFTATPKQFGSISGTPIWNYDKQKFSLVGSKTDKSACSITLKAITDVTSTPISLSVPITYTYMSLVAETTALGNLAVKISSPFYITSDTKLVCPDSHITANMPKLNYVSGATVNWISGNGLSIVSGQGTGNAIFAASGSINGYTRIEAKTTYNGKTYSSVIDSIWIGKPIITNTEDQFTIEDRNYNISIKPQAIGIDNATNYKWILKSGNASLTTFSNGNVEIKSLAAPLSTDIITVSLQVNNTCGTSTKDFNISVIKGADIITNISAYEGAYVDVPIQSMYSDVLSTRWLLGSSMGQYVRYTFDYNEWINSGMPKVFNGNIIGKDGKKYTVRIYVYL
ncbi:hypothetical protein [uncultured Bacteroides sp.]|uniref:hypothetical protein n=1 Tax=uncultured Bacteroides sp. TaxID=162156 RepID=UPI00280B3981|nr:hypothetical protein [uncultured Bacteroides sp.]